MGFFHEYGLGELAISGREYSTGQRMSLALPAGYQWVPSRLIMGVPILWKIQWIPGYGAQKETASAAAAETMPSGWTPSSNILTRLQWYKKVQQQQSPSSSVITPGAPAQNIPSGHIPASASLPGAQSIIQPKTGLSPLLIVGGLGAAAFLFLKVFKKKKRSK